MNKNLIDLLECVNDRATFIAFAEALATDRRRVERIEAMNPERYKWGGAERWNNNCISLFIEGGLSHFDPGPHGDLIETPTWKDFAEFLYCGMIME